MLYFYILLPTCAQLLQRGHWVVICDVKDPADAVATLREKHSGGVGKIEGIQCDVSDAKSVENLAQFAKEKIGIVHYWINNAGINGGVSSRCDR